MALSASAISNKENRGEVEKLQIMLNSYINDPQGHEEISCGCFSNTDFAEQIQDKANLFFSFEKTYNSGGS